MASPTVKPSGQWTLSKPFVRGLLGYFAVCALHIVAVQHWFVLSAAQWAVLAGAMLLLGLLLLWAWLHRLEQQIQALNIQADSLRDQSFNVAANQQLLYELQPLGDSLNAMAQELAQQRASLYQRELLLDTVLQTNPAALVLTDDKQRVLLSNPAARVLLGQGRRFDGSDLLSVLSDAPALRSACETRQQGLIHLADESVWHLSINQFQLNQRQHWLYLFKPMTREFQREEVKAWKKLLRVIGHELNNSLAPMSSLAFSGQRLLKQWAANGQGATQSTGSPQQPQLLLNSLQHDAPAQLSRIFEHLAERSQQLNQFLQGYLEFARLPPPQRGPVQWSALFNQLQDHYEFDLQGDLPKLAWQLDVAQLTQLLLNLLKNAREAGATDAGTSLLLEESSQALCLTLIDDAGGMPTEVLEHALVPFYTTKTQGSGIGLTLCRDIMESHAGQLELRNVPGGLAVRLTFPAAQNLLVAELS